MSVGVENSVPSRCSRLERLGSPLFTQLSFVPIHPLTEKLRICPHGQICPTLKAKVRKEVNYCVTILSDAHRESRSKMLAVLFVSATMLMAAAGAVEAAPRAKCRHNPENFAFFHDKCLSDKRIEQLKERAHHRGEDHQEDHHGRHHG